MGKFLILFSIIWFGFSMLLLLGTFWIVIFDKERKRRDEELEKQFKDKNYPFDSIAHSNRIFLTLNSNLVHIGIVLISILGIFFSIVIFILTLEYLKV